MEGKAALFKRFAGVDAWPVCLDTQDTDEIVDIVKLPSPRSTAASTSRTSPRPAASRSRRRLREMLDIPVFHDDQHGTAIVVLAALTNALRWWARRCRTSGSSSRGAAPPGRRSSGCCSRKERGDIIAFDTRGAVHTGRDGLDAYSEAGSRSTRTMPAPAGSLVEGLPAPTSSSASRPRACSPARTSRRWPTRHRPRAGQPGPRGRPDRGAAARRGRRHRPGDYPNQINNVLAFPGFFRGLLDAGARTITDEMLVAAAQAIADAVEPGRAQPELYRAQRVRPRGRTGRRRRRPVGRRADGRRETGSRRAVSFSRRADGLGGGVVRGPRARDPRGRPGAVDALGERRVLRAGR